MQSPWEAGRLWIFSKDMGEGMGTRRVKRRVRVGRRGRGDREESLYREGREGS